MNADTQPDTKTLFKMLSSTFGLFGTGLYLFILFISNPTDNKIFLCLSGIPLILASFLLVAVETNKKCFTLYKIAKWLDEKFVTIWVFMFTLAIALIRLIQIYIALFRNPESEHYAIWATVILIFSVLFIVAFYIVMLRLPLSTDETEAAHRKLEFQLVGAFCFLFSPLLSAGLSIWFPSQSPEPIGGMLLLVVAAIFIIFALRNTPTEKPPLISALIITVVNIVLLGIGYALSGCLLWYYICSFFTLIALIALTIGMYKIGRQMQTTLITHPQG